MREAMLIMAFTAVLAAPALAQTPVCDGLTGPARALAVKLLESEHPYDCCDDTIARCLAARPTCALAVRLADNICRRVAAGEDETRIRRGLSRRARSMLGGGAQASIDLTTAPVAGEEGAPVTVVVYACGRCPYCAKLVPLLHGEIQGRLKGRARLVFRTFPIRGHEGSTEAGLAFTAAARMGRFWEYALLSYRRFAEFSPERLSAWATEAGLDAAVFAAHLADPSTRDELIAIKKEGLVNGIGETPTLFINGRRWTGDLTLAEVVDAIEEEAERVRGQRWVQR
ncbi:MAG: DsbA family protein [Acidobacteria bacterium]|nr:DsbA family protein [Acidobacteriota bacterium]